MNKKITNPAATGRTTAKCELENCELKLMKLEKKIIQDLNDCYKCAYRDLKYWLDKIDDQYINEESSYSFVGDMFRNIGGDNTQLNDYINQMLETHCKNNWQAYFEMMLSCMVMETVFSSKTHDFKSITEQFDFFKDWRKKMVEPNGIYSQYVSDKDMETYWRLNYYISKYSNRHYD